MDYLSWNDALAERFFRPECDGQRVFLFVTEALIAEIGASTDEALSDFIRAVLAGPPFVFGESLCERASRSLFNWRRGGRKWPPYLGYLALFVLAAGLDGEFSPIAYYPRLRKLLGDPPLTGMYPGFDRMHRLWEDLEVWSTRDQHGELGVFRFQLPSRLVHVGIPISQVILNERERLLLPELFSEAGLAGAPAPSEQFMSHCLLRYGSRKLRARTLNVLRRDLGSTDELELIVSVALDEFDTWDGTFSRQASATGEKRGVLRICLDIDDITGRVKARLRCRAQGDFPDGTVELVSGGSRFTCEKETENWSTVLADADSFDELDASQLDWSAKLDAIDQSNNLRFQMPVSVARIFASGAEEDLNGYVEIQGLPQKQEVFIAAEDSAASDIENWGRRSCEGFTEVRIQRGLPCTWRLFKIERVLDDRWIRHKYTQFTLSREAQLFIKGGIRDRSGAYFPFALPALDAIGDSSSLTLTINGQQRVIGELNRYQLDIADVEDLRITVELGQDGRAVRTRTLYVRSSEQPIDYAQCWVDAMGQQTSETSLPRISGSEIVCDANAHFCDWVEEYCSDKQDTLAEPPDALEPIGSPENEAEFRSRARALLREWKAEINGPIVTSYRSRLAGLPMGGQLTEGALQYKRASKTGSEREYARAFKELSQALASEEAVVRMVAYVLLALIARRTDRRHPQAPQLPEHARAALENIFHPTLGSDADEQLSLSDFSPVEGEDSRLDCAVDLHSGREV